MTNERQELLVELCEKLIELATRYVKDVMMLVTPDMNIIDPDMSEDKRNFNLLKFCIHYVVNGALEVGIPVDSVMYDAACHNVKQAFHAASGNAPDIQYVVVDGEDGLEKLMNLLLGPSASKNVM